MAKIGTIIDGKYEILKQIGKGGMSRVYLAMDIRLNKQWAVKELRRKAHSIDNEVVMQGLIAEANLLKRLDYPALPRIVDIIETNETIYIVMDYIEGENLQTILKEYGPQTEEVVLTWAKQLCGVLHYLHTRTPAIIYRDMKPGNVIITPDGNLKLIDFGIAREYKEENISDTISLGTKGYAAPEQFGGQGQTDARTDIYSFGVTLYTILTGKNPSEPPYEIYPIRYWNSNLSGGLEKIIEKCTQLNPQDRYQSCTELLYALQHYEEYDEDYRKGLRRKLVTFGACSAATILLGITSLGLGVSIHCVETNSYEQRLEEAKNSVTYEEKEKQYLEAIKIIPDGIEAYQNLIELYKDDAVFTTEESNQLVRLLNQNKTQLMKKEGYPEIAFQIGKLYWYYYEYGKENAEGNNESNRMISSVNWFAEVLELTDESYENYEIAKIYHEIGGFHKDIVLAQEEAEDSGRYEAYFKSLVKFQKTMDEKESDLVILEYNKLMMNAITNYAGYMKKDGVKKSELEACLAQVNESTSKIHNASEKLLKMKTYIEDNYDIASEYIQIAYQ